MGLSVLLTKAQGRLKVELACLAVQGRLCLCLCFPAVVLVVLVVCVGFLVCGCRGFDFQLQEKQRDGNNRPTI